MRIMKQLLFLSLMMLLWNSVAAAYEIGGQAPIPCPNLVSQAKYPVNVGSGEYDLMTAILYFPAEAEFGKSIRFAVNVLVSVIIGEMTLRDKGTDKVVKAGESWTESPGNIHAVANAGTATSRVVAVFLLPKGAEAQTMVK